MHRRWKWFALALAVGLVPWTTAQGEEASTNDVTELGEITVTATRRETTAYDAPNAVTVVTREEIDRRMPFGAIDALFDEPGVYTQRTTNGQGSPMIRSFTGYHTLMLVDGVRLNNTTFRSGPNQYFNTINIDTIERIEVVRGPASSLYGNASMGGVIHVITRQPKPMGDSLTLKPRLFGRWGSSSNDFTAGAGIEGGQGNVVFSAQASYKEVGDVTPGKGFDVHVKGKKFFLTSETDETKIPARFLSNGVEYERTKLYDVESPTHYTEMAGNASLAYLLDEKKSIRLVYQGVAQNVSARWDKIASGEDYERFEYDPQDRHLAYINFRGEDLSSAIDELSATVSFHRQTEGQWRLKVGKDPNKDTKRTEDAINSYGVSLVATSQLAEGNELTYGFDSYFDAVSSIQTLPSEKAWGRFPDGSKALDIDVFVQDEAKLADNVTATVGVNFTSYRVESDLTLKDPEFGLLEKTGSAITGNAAIAYEIVEGVKIHGAGGTGFRAPNLSDLSSVEVTNQGIKAPSPDVTPERSVNLEAGLKVRRPRFGGSVTLFNMLVTDKMVDRPVEDVYGDDLPPLIKDLQAANPDVDITVLDNLDETAIRGVEMDLYVSPADGVTLYGIANYIRGEVLRLKGKKPNPDKPWEARIRREPPLYGTVGVRYEPVEGSYWAEIFARGATKQNRLSKGDIRDPRMPGFTRKPEKVAFDEDGRAIDAGTPGWVTLNVRVGVTLFGQTRLTFAVENIFDRRYRWHGSGVDAPGRNVLVSVDQRF